MRLYCKVIRADLNSLLDICLRVLQKLIKFTSHYCAVCDNDDVLWMFLSVFTVCMEKVVSVGRSWGGHCQEWLFLLLFSFFCFYFCFCFIVNFSLCFIAIICCLFLNIPWITLTFNNKNKDQGSPALPCAWTSSPLSFSPFARLLNSLHTFLHVFYSSFSQFYFLHSSSAPFSMFSLHL